MKSKTGIIEPCTELGYNNFPSTNFHGELSIEETEQLRQKLIQSLKDEGKLDKAEYIENNTRVMEVTFNCANVEYKKSVGIKSTYLSATNK